MKATAKIQILTVVTAMVTASVSFGMGCPGTSNVQEEMKQFGALISEKIDGNRNTEGVRLKAENEMHKLDLNKSSDPRIRALNAIGIVTKDQEVLLGAKEGRQMIGTAFAISKCHVLVSYHVLNAQHADKKMSAAKVGDEFWTHLGQGKSCNGNASFKISSRGTVQDMGGMDDETDWAVIKLDSPTAEITPLPFSLKKPRERSQIMRVGHPVAESMKDNSYFFRYGQLTEITRYGAGEDGLMYVHDSSKRYGTSGSPALDVVQNGVEAIGLTIGTGEIGNGAILPMKSIFKQMKKATRDNIVKAIKEGSCG